MDIQAIRLTQAWIANEQALERARQRYQVRLGLRTLIAQAIDHAENEAFKRSLICRERRMFDDKG